MVIKRELRNFADRKELGINLGILPSALNVIEKKLQVCQRKTESSVGGVAEKKFQHR